jgi:hypothetical protein
MPKSQKFGLGQTKSSCQNVWQMPKNIRVDHQDDVHMFLRKKLQQKVWVENESLWSQKHFIKMSRRQEKWSWSRLKDGENLP